LSLAISGQSLKTIAGQGAEIFERQGCFQAIQLQASGPLNAFEGSHAIPGGEIRSALVSIALDHSSG